MTVEAFDAAARLARFATQRPNEEVVSDLRTTLTYDDLTSRAAGVAEWVAEHPGTNPVVVLVDISVESVVAVLGVLWAGRGVVPLDATDPPERLLQLARLCGATLVLDATVVGTTVVDGLDVSRSDARRGVMAPTEADSKAVAAIHVTSGSSGAPKAVVRTFAQLNEYCESSRAHPYFGTPLRTALFMPLHFAGGFTAMLFGLAAGRYVTMVDMRRTPAAEVAKVIARQRIERIHLTPSLARSLATALDGRAPRASVDSLRDVWLTGEPLSWSEVGMVRAAFPALDRVLYVYAASEATCLVTAYVIEPRTPLGTGRVPLGFAQNTSGLRLDPVEGRADAGELVVLGEVSDRYLNDAELTQSRFGADQGGGRFWRSGDLVSRDDDGCLHHLGRLDDMVKINGRLVEPAEAERVLGAIPGMRGAVVIPRRLPAGRDQLVAYVEADESLSVDVVREELRRQLPVHLLPAVLVRLDALPVTDRGKVDRAALRAAPIEPWGTPTPTMRVDRLVEVVCATVADVLGLDHVDPDADLWDLGCDSLSAIELVTALTDDGREDLRPDDLLTASTSRQVAEILRSRSGGQRSEVQVIRGDLRGRPTYFIPGGGGFALSYRPLLMELGGAGPTVAYEQRGLHRRGRRDHTISAAARRNLRDLKRRQPNGPYVLVGHSWGGVVAHEMARRLHGDGHRVVLVLLDSARKRPAGAGALAPDSLRNRKDRWPMYAAKYVTWSFARERRMWPSRWARIKRPIGSLGRYDAFYVFAGRTLRRARPQALDVPTLLVYVAGSGASTQWDDHPALTKVQVDGDHITMLRPPHVGALVRTIERFVADVTRGDTIVAR